jgi:rubrerythrin
MGRQMTPRSALEQISADLAAIKGELRQLYVQWCVSGPTLESSSALAAMAQEESGHARILSRLAADTPCREITSELIRKDELTSWPELVGTAGPVEIVLAWVVSELRRCDDPEFGRKLLKVAAEERYHVQFFLGWFDELGGDESSAGARFADIRAVTEARLRGWIAASETWFAPAGIASQDHRLDIGQPSAHDAGVVACVHCGSPRTSTSAAFGASLMTELRRCETCGTRFESVRWKTVSA